MVATDEARPTRDYVIAFDKRAMSAPSVTVRADTMTVRKYGIFFERAGVLVAIIDRTNLLYCREAEVSP